MSVDLVTGNDSGVKYDENIDTQRFIRRCRG